MTPELFLDNMVEALREIFGNDDYLLTVNGTLKALAVFPNDLPIPQGNDMDDEDVDTDIYVPYIIARIQDGSFEDWGEAHKVRVTLIICTYDPDTNRQGWRDVMSIITRIFRRFAADPHVGNFTCELPIEWAKQDEVETYPYYFGGMQLSFSGPGVLIEDPLT